MPQGTDGRLVTQCARHLLVAGALLWARVAFAACGDGILDPGETCDGGIPGTAGCCTGACTAEAPGTPCPDDGNPCSEDRCDSVGVCTHPAGGTAACDDGDSCTNGDACSDGRCVGTSAPEQCIDAAYCYRARATAPFPDVGVGFDDQFTVPDGTVSRLDDLCLPASASAAPLLDPAIPHVDYRIHVRGQPATFSRQVTDQFGTRMLQTGRVERVLVASHASTGGPPAGPPAPGSANHYVCRRVRFAPGSPDVRGTAVTVDDALGSRQRTLLKPKRLCSPADLNVPGTGMVHPQARLMCYTLRSLGLVHGPAIQVQTANLLGNLTLAGFEAGELCVPARIEPSLPACDSSGHECGLPCCRSFGGQHPDCAYDPVIPSPRYLGCSGPTILVDRTHVNFHQTVPESQRNPGRFWGFAKLLGNDGYVVRDNTVPWAALLPTTTAKILVVANAQSLKGPEAFPPDDVTALVDWVQQGGSLLLSIDHSPYNKAEALLTALGLVLGRGSARKFTFTRASGDLNGASVIANGTVPAETIDEVTTFTGSAFSISPLPPAQAQYEAVLTYPLDTPGSSDGLLQGVTIQFGAGRVYVSGESGGLTAQNRFGMQFTPDNEQYVLNIIHWLDY
jgi:hypothetical protein